MRVEKSGSSLARRLAWCARWFTTSRRYDSPAKRKQATRAHGLVHPAAAGHGAMHGVMPGDEEAGAQPGLQGDVQPGERGVPGQSGRHEQPDEVPAPRAEDAQREDDAPGVGRSRTGVAGRSLHLTC